jgi:predicted nucleic acid-binding protein
VTGFLYDTGVLVAGDRNDRAVWAMHRRILEQGVRPTVPTTVLAQAWRGGPQPLLSRMLAGCRLEPFDEADARETGRALARAKARDVIDACVVVTAFRRNETIVTGDPDDIRAITDTMRPRPPMRALRDLG